MKKIYGLLIVALTVSACLPIPAPSTPAPLPEVDARATIDSIVNTAAAQTLAVLPSPTLASATETLSAPTNTPVAVNTDLSSTAIENLTTTPATATAGTEISTSSTPASGTQPASGNLTVTPTLGVLTYGTLPPAVAYSQITLLNKSKVQAYISLQNCPPDRPMTILEYPVNKQVNVNAPLGPYMYVAWIGGRQFTGSFALNQNEQLTITLYKDKVTIQ